MATFRRIEDELVNCPYNKSHWIKKSRLQAHMVKCRENCLPDCKKICPFNATHCIHESEFQQHLGTCPDKAAIDKKVFEIAKGDSTFKGHTAVPSYSAFSVSQNENWEEDFTDAHRLQALGAEERTFVQSKSAQSYQESQTKESSELSSECSNDSEEEKDCPFKHDVPNNWKTKDFIGMGRGQAILERLSLSLNQTGIQESNHHKEMPVGRGRGFVTISNDFSCAKEYHSVDIEEDSNKLGSEKSHSKQIDYSCDSASSHSSLEGSKSCTVQCENPDRLSTLNFIGMGRGRRILNSLEQSINQNDIREPTNETKIQQSSHQNESQPGCSIGRARGFVSNSRGRKLLMDNSRIVVDKEHVQITNSLTINDNSIQYNIENLPPCRPGEIRSVPLFCE